MNFENEDANHDLDKKAQSFIALFPSLLLLVSHQNPLLGLFFAVRGTMETSVPHAISFLNSKLHTDTNLPILPIFFDSIVVSISHMDSDGSNKIAKT